MQELHLKGTKRMRNIHYINAGAGSGKTHSLTEILVKHIKSGECRPSEILLTTFTELAAGEFRQRAYDSLIREGCLEQAASLGSATMGTLHSIALAFVQKYWYLLRRGTTVNVLSDRDKMLIIKNAASRVFSDDDRKKLGEFEKCFLDGNRGRWPDSISDMLDKSYVFGIDDLETSREHSVSLIKKIFSEKPLDAGGRGFISGLCRQYGEICKERNNGTAINNRNILLHAAGRCTFRADYNLFKLFSEKVVQRDWRQLGPDNRQKIIDLLYRAIRSSSYGKVAADACRCIVNAAVRVKEELHKYKAAHGYIEYNDMEKLFLELLDNEIVRKDIGRSVKYVFVDEFQDSSPVQIEIFKKLSDLVSKSYWVGDVKQSIYGFRGSAPEMVMELTSEIFNGSAEGCSYENLEYSWRSSEALVEFDSKIAKTIFPDDSRYPNPGLRHAPKGNNTVVEHPVQHWVAEPGRNDNALPGLIGRHIKEILEDSSYDLQPEDIAILARRNEKVGEIANALKACGLQVSAKETKSEMFLNERLPLMDKAEVQLLLALLKYSANKDTYCKAELAVLLQDVSASEIIEDKDGIIAGFDKLGLDALFDRIRNSSLADKVNTLVSELDLCGFCARWGNAWERRLNIRKLQTAAADYDIRCVQLGRGASVEGFIDEVEELIQQSRTEDRNGGVNVMTYHAAKGLQWKMVILYDLWDDVLKEQKLKNRFVVGIQKVIDGEKTLLRYIPDIRNTDKNTPDFFFDADTFSSSLFNHYVDNCREEEKRLLYVGFTRAKDYLVSVNTANAAFNWLLAAGLNPSTEKEGFRWKGDMDSVKTITLHGSGTEDAAGQPEAIWHKPRLLHTARVAKYLNPSDKAVETASRIIAQYKIHEGIALSGSYDSEEAGTCIHNYFAVHGTPGFDNLSAAKRLIGNFSLTANIEKPEQLPASAEALFKWFGENAGDVAALHKELPFSQRLKSGQVVNGRIDLMVEMKDRHCLLVDYKTARTEKEYAPQMLLYKRALEAWGFTVDHCYIFYPVLGQLDEIDFKEEGTK